MTVPWRGPLALVALIAAAGAGVSSQTRDRAGPSPQSAEARPGTRFQGEEALVRVYDAILDARFDEIDVELGKACGPAPPEACDVLEATAVWWRILLDPEGRGLDKDFLVAVERAIRTTEAWTERSPDSAEAWFYMGGAYAARVQWRVLRGEKVAAARDGKRIKEALEQAITLDPTMDDAYFGIGMYQYYADVAPAAAKILRFLLLLPGGDKQEGLARMVRARDRGRLLEGEADYQLHIIYLWYEEQTARAIELLRGLHRQYPGNPLFVAHIAEIQDTYEHDLTASLTTWRTLLSLAREQRVNAHAIAEVRARLGIARHLETLHQTDQAIEQLDAVIAAKPEVPHAALALAHLRLGEAYDRLGDREAALAAYRSAASAAAAPDVFEIAASSARRQRQRPDPRRTEAYRLSIDGLRRLERNDAVGASAALTRSLALNGRDPVARYRYARVLQAQRDDSGALAQYDLAIREARVCPPPILGMAYLEGARLHERAGRRDEALAWYRIASTLFGAAQETRSAATRALARLDGVR